MKGTIKTRSMSALGVLMVALITACGGSGSALPASVTYGAGRVVNDGNLSASTLSAAPGDVVTVSGDGWPNRPLEIDLLVNAPDVVSAGRMLLSGNYHRVAQFIPVSPDFHLEFQLQSRLEAVAGPPLALKAGDKLYFWSRSGPSSDQGPVVTIHK
jgi:hypothetical protein